MIFRLPSRQWAPQTFRCSQFRVTARPFSFGPVRGQSSPTALPEIVAEMEDGASKPIPETDLYRFTRYRWLCNERQQQEKRYLKFNLNGLIDVAVKACKGATSCIKILKCKEGGSNKAFILTMDNGAEIFAKLPNPNAGPKHYCTASEVATRHMLREVFKIPNPQILAWSDDAANNAVQAEYIIEEKAQGVPLGSLWSAMSHEKKVPIISQVVKFDASLCATRFTAHGCIYFKEDLRRITGCPTVTACTVENQNLNLEKYAMGPLTEAMHWRKGTEGLDLERGPWHDLTTYPEAIARNEIKWIKKNAKPKMNPTYSTKALQDPKDALELLDKYLSVASMLAPQEDDGEDFGGFNVLWHPDLHSENIFIDPTSHQITAIIDWQSADVAPIFYQSGYHMIHAAFRCPDIASQDFQEAPKKPENYDTLSEEEKKKAKEHYVSEWMHKWYQIATYNENLPYFHVLSNEAATLLRQPMWSIPGVWEGRHRLFNLRHALIVLVKRWDILFTNTERHKCSISFTPEELAQHEEEKESVEVIEKMGKMVGDPNFEGVVWPTGEGYQEKAKLFRELKEEYLNRAENEEDRKECEIFWPWNDDEE